MREIRTKMPSAVGAVDCVAVQARGALKHMSSRSFFLILLRWLLLLVCPSLEVFRAIYVHAQKHLCVLFPASCGIQKLWSVSAESSVKNVGVGWAESLTGMCNSFAVTMPSAGYRNSHQN